MMREAIMISRCTRCLVFILLAGAAFFGVLPAPMAAAAPADDPALVAAVNGPQRSPAFQPRDKYRHPLAALSFFGLKPGMTIVEIWPSGGYWTEILAPFAKATGGRYFAAVAKEGQTLPAQFANPAVYGTIQYTVFNDKSGPLVAPGTADFVLTSRNIHDWTPKPGYAEKAMRDFYAALKPGGLLAVVDHRADPRPMMDQGSDGYLSTAYVVGLAEKAGFQLEAKSEINANPKDTKDHPFGVWTLPPTLQSAPRGQPANPKFDKAKYLAIGESDRMTLRFRKPG
jgi:predicted methyltransferase